MFYLRLETGASSNPPAEGCAELVEIANRLGIAVHANINGIEVTVLPGDKGSDVTAAFKLAQERKLDARKGP